MKEYLIPILLGGFFFSGSDFPECSRRLSCHVCLKGAKLNNPKSFTVDSADNKVECLNILFTPKSHHPTSLSLLPNYPLFSFTCKLCFSPEKVVEFWPASTLPLQQAHMAGISVCVLKSHSAVLASTLCVCSLLFVFYLWLASHPLKWQLQDTFIFVLSFSFLFSPLLPSLLVFKILSLSTLMYFQHSYFHGAHCFQASTAYIQKVCF